MLRYPLSFSLRSRIKTQFTLDVYTHQFIPVRSRTIEHVLPVRFLPCKKTQTDPMHLFMTTAILNRFRSDYRFCRDPQSHGRFSNREWEVYEGCYRHRGSRLFFPFRGHRLIAHTCWEMIKAYPQVTDVVGDHCFDSWETLETWLRVPWDPVEKEMISIQKKMV